MKRLFLVSRVILMLTIIGLMPIWVAGVTAQTSSLDGPSAVDKVLECTGKVEYTATYTGSDGDLYLYVENLVFLFDL